MQRPCAPKARRPIFGPLCIRPTILPFLCSCPFLVSIFSVSLCVLLVLCGSSKATARCYTSICDGIILLWIWGTVPFIDQVSTSQIFFEDGHSYCGSSVLSCGKPFQGPCGLSLCGLSSYCWRSLPVVRIRQGCIPVPGCMYKTTHLGYIKDVSRRTTLSIRFFLRCIATQPEYILKVT